MDNLQKSERVIALILQYLVENGIQRCDLSDDTLELGDELKPFFSQCMKWLINEGVIGADNVSETLDGSIFVVNPVITSYGFNSLGQNVVLDDAEQKLGRAVQEVSKTGKSYSAIGDFVGGLLGGFTKSIGS